MGSGRLSRRRILKLTGAGVVAGAAASSGVSATESDYPNTIIFDGTVSRGKSNYEFEVTGGVDPDRGTETQEVNDTVDGNRVKGAVHRDKDVYHFGGDLTFLSIKGDAGVSIEYGDEGDVKADRLEIVAGTDSEVNYTFTAADRIEIVTDNGDNSAESYNDSVQENDDGSWTATGATGNGYGDSYDFWGEPEHFEPVEGDFTLFLNGEEITVPELTGQETEDGGGANVFNIRSTEETPAMYYDFSVDGEVHPHDSVEDHDDIVQDGDVTRVEGQVGPNGQDAYEVPAKLESWTAVDTDGNPVDESRFGLYWNGEEVALDDVLVDQQSHVFGIRSTDDTPAMYYEFVVDSEFKPHNSVEDHDTITAEGDGYRVEGQVGPNGQDAYVVPGKLLEWNAVDADGRYVPEADFGLYWDDVETTLEEVLQGGKPQQRLEVVCDGEIDYTFVASDEIELVTENGDNSAEMGNDDVYENDDGTWTADGYTGNGYGDAVDFKGGAMEFWPQEGNFALYLDDEQVTPWELIGADEPQEPDVVEGGPVGGGYGYDRTVSRDQADYVVSTRSELDSALASATSGDVVYVAGNAEIYLGDATFTVPRGVTLASNRGIDDAPGGLLHTDQETDSFYVRTNARVTGVRVQGPYYEYFDPSWYATGTGIEITESGAEIDNCEVWGHAYAAIYAGADSHVHHNHIHHTPRDGLGYGVLQSGSHPTIEWNYFNYNRHAVASTGSGGYTVRYNHFGPDTIGHVIDMHKPGGNRMEIYNNTVEGYEAVKDGSQKPAVAIRGVPNDVATIYDNWFYNPDEPRNSPSGWTTECIIQVHVDSWTDVTWSNNHLGSSEPASDIGCPR
jgi:hypothetical protein